jgi:hypothetical protein
VDYGATVAGAVSVAAPLDAEAVNGTLNPLDYAGSDLGAKINAAYAALPSSGGHIKLPAGNYSVSTPIVFTTKQVSFDCDASTTNGGGETLTWTPTSGTMFLLNGSAVHMNGCLLAGPGGSNTAIGIATGGSNSFIFGSLTNTNVSGFNVGLEILTNSYIDTFTNNNFVNNTTDLYIPSGQTNVGENLYFNGGSFTQPGGSSTAFSKTCVNIETGIEVHFDSVSFDQCGVSLNAVDTLVTMIAPHFEDNSNGSAIPFVTIDASCKFCSFTSTGGEWWEDVTSARTSFIGVATTTANVGSDVNLYGGTYTPAETITQLVLDASECCAQGTAFGLENGVGGVGFTNVFGGAWYNGKVYNQYGAFTLSGNLTVGGSLLLPSITGTQCLHSVSGTVSGTGSECGSGGSAVALTCTNSAPSFSVTASVQSCQLSLNLTAPSIAAGTNGFCTTFIFEQGASTAYTVAAPSNTRGFGTVGTTLSGLNSQRFCYSSIASTWVASGPMIVNM